LDGLARRLPVFLRKSVTGQNEDWKARLHGVRKYWNQQGGEHIRRETWSWSVFTVFMFVSWISINEESVTVCNIQGV